jgi:hypothetical protein
MKVSNLPFFLILILFCLIVNACDNCEKKPCKCATPASADFIIEEHNEWYSYDYNDITDTIMSGNYAVFTARYDDMSSYEWKVGNDARTFTDSEFRLEFEDSMTIPVRLIVEQDLACFPETERRDTVIKYLKVADFSEWPFYGEYEGVQSHQPDKVSTLTLVDESLGDYSALGMGEDGCNKYTSLSPFFKKIVIDYGACNVIDGGIGILRNTKQLEFEYRFFDNNTSSVITTTFVGTKK